MQNREILSVRTRGRGTRRTSVGHVTVGSSRPSALDVGAREARRGWQERLLVLFLQGPFIRVRVGTVRARRRTVNVICPVFDGLGSLHTLGIGLLAKAPQTPRQEPPEDDRHGKLDAHNSDNENQGNIKHDLGSNATDAARIDEPNGDEVLQAVGQPLLGQAVGVHGNVAALEGGIGSIVADVVEELRIGDLRVAEPFQQVEVEDVANRMLSQTLIDVDGEAVHTIRKPPNCGWCP